MTHLLLCRQYNRWPFPNNRLTFYQSVYLAEAMRQLDEKPPDTPKKPRRLSREEMQQLANGNQ